MSTKCFVLDGEGLAGPYLGLSRVYNTCHHHIGRAALGPLLRQKEDENKSRLCICNGRRVNILDDAVDSEGDARSALVSR